MPWLELKLRADRNQARALAEALEGLGAISVTLQDAGDEPVFETQWEQNQLWSQVQVTGLFPEQTSIPEVLDSLKRHTGITTSLESRVATLPDQNWERTWMERYQPQRVGKNLWVCPSWCAPPEPDAVNVILDPGLAFGTGTHESTALCLEWLAEQELAHKTIVDYGCGSGILAIAALKLGAAMAYGVDYDARAMDTSRENARRNGVADRYHALPPESLPTHQRADIVVANILAQTLIALAPRLTRLVQPGGLLALAGLLADQADEVRAHYAAHFALETRTRGEWVLLAGRKTTDNERSAISDQRSAKQAISGQRSAISYQLELCPKGSPNTEGHQKHRPEVCALLGSPYGAPAHRKVPGERPERGADRMSAPDLRGRMPRKISAGSRNRGCGG